MLLKPDIESKIFSIKTEEEFNAVALAVFHYQYENNKVYQSYINHIGVNREEIKHYSEIPFLPIEFFKSMQVVCGDLNPQHICFTSSGTTGQITSKHYVNDVRVYEESFLNGFELFYGKPQNYCILALLPNYLERTGSSLVYMFDRLIKESGHGQSGFYLNNYKELSDTIETLKAKKQKTLLLGVTYALLDLADMDVTLTPDFIVMETGGMKGKRQELLKEEVHQILKSELKVSGIHSEYGMTELLSQAYSKKDGLFECPPWMRVLVRDVNDPFSYVKTNKNGGINVIDLANVYSCSFIETKDLGRLNEANQFEIIGRFDNSDIRGCNLMIE